MWSTGQHGTWVLVSNEKSWSLSRPSGSEWSVWQDAFYEGQSLESIVFAPGISVPSSLERGACSRVSSINSRACVWFSPLMLTHAFCAHAWEMNSFLLLRLHQSPNPSFEELKKRMKLFFMEAERILGNSSHFTKLSGTGNLFNWFSICTNFFSVGWSICFSYFLVGVFFVCLFQRNMYLSRPIWHYLRWFSRCPLPSTENTHGLFTIHSSQYPRRNNLFSIL